MKTGLLKFIGNTVLKSVDPLSRIPKTKIGQWLGIKSVKSHKEIDYVTDNGKADYLHIVIVWAIRFALIYGLMKFFGVDVDKAFDLANQVSF